MKKFLHDILEVFKDIVLGIIFMLKVIVFIVCCIAAACYALLKKAAGLIKHITERKTETTVYVFPVRHSTVFFNNFYKNSPQPQLRAARGNSLY